MGLINLIKLSVISLGTIHTITSSSPGSAGGGVAFMSRTFILVGKLVQVNITLGNNRTGLGVVHATVNNHPISRLQGVIFLVQNRAGTNHLGAVSHGSAIRHSSLCTFLHSDKTHSTHYILNILRISPWGDTSISNVLISLLILLRLLASIKSDYLRSLSIIRHSRSDNIKRRSLSSNQGMGRHRPTAGHISHNAPLGSIHTSRCRTRIVTGKAHTSKPKRISHLHRKRNITIIRKSIGNITWKLHTTIQGRIPLQLLGKLHLRFGDNLIVIVNDKIRRNILNPLLHRRRIYVHIIILRNRKVAGIIHPRRRIRHNLIISRRLPGTFRCQTTITVPVKRNHRGLTSCRPHSIRCKNKAGTLKGHLIKDSGQLLILSRTAKHRIQRQLARASGIGGNRLKLNRHGCLNLNDKVGTITLLGSSAHITTRSSRRIRSAISSHVGVEFPTWEDRLRRCSLRGPGSPNGVRVILVARPTRQIPYTVRGPRASAIADFAALRPSPSRQ